MAALPLSEAAASGAPLQPGLDLPPDDKLVSTLDVVVCSAADALGGRVVLLQQPLRGAWRPYDLPRASAVRMRPKARRLEIELPLQTSGVNYNRAFGLERRDTGKPKRGGARRGAAAAAAEDGEADGPGEGGGGEEANPMGTLLLRSQSAEGGGGEYAVGVVRGGRLLLVPVDYALQLRPHLAHLNIPAAAADKGGGRGGGRGGEADGEGGGEEGDGEGLVEIEVQVKRRETERQQAARLKSFSYLQAEEEGEEWRKLKIAEAAGHQFWGAVVPTAEAEAAAAAAAPAASLPRAAYLSAITPGAGGPGAAPGGGSVRGAPGAGAPAAAPPRTAGAPAPLPPGVHGATPQAALAPSAPQGLSSDAAAAVRRALRELFRVHSVANLEDVRAHLRTYGEAGGLARQGATLKDDALHAAILDGGEFAALRRAYAARPPARDAAGELRHLILDLLADRSQVRKSDVVAAARDRSVPFAEGQYNKIMRELCRNNAGTWTVKTGVDG